MCAVEFGFTISAEDEHTLVAQLTQQMAQEPERAAIRPVQIVSIEEQRLASRDIGKHLYDGVEEKQAFFVRCEFLTFGEWAESRFDVGCEFRDLHRRVAEDLA